MIHLHFLYHPVFYCPCFCGETDSALDQFPSISSIWYHIPFLVYLLQRLLCRFVYLQFEHINGRGGKHHHVRTTTASFNLRFDMTVHEREHQVENGFVIIFALSHVLQNLFATFGIRNAGQIGTQNMECFFHIFT